RGDQRARPVLFVLGEAARRQDQADSRVGRPHLTRARIAQSVPVKHMTIEVADMTSQLIYHDPATVDTTSPFDKVIVSIVKDQDVWMACPYLSLDYLCRIAHLAKSWCLLTDIPEWLSSRAGKNDAENVCAFIDKERNRIWHCPSLHAKVIA